MIEISLTALNYFHKAHFTGSGRIKPVAEFGCYYCGEIYRVADKPIIEWVDGGYTALCPVCGIDAVIPKIFRSQFTVQDMEILRQKMFWD